MFAGVLQHNYKGFIMSTTENTLIHKNLTDPQLHEPKGIASANVDTVYFADGSGNGSWQKIDISKVSFERAQVVETEMVAAEEVTELSRGTLPAFTPVDRYVDNNSFGDVNRNFYESLTKIEQLRNSLAIAHTNIAALNETVTELREALITAGVILNGQ